MQDNIQEQKNMLFAQPRNDAPKEQVQDAFTKQTIEIARRLKLLEERYGNIRNHMQLADQNFIHFQKDIKKDIKVLHASLLDFKKQLHDMQRHVNQMQDGLVDIAHKNELQVLAKYVQMWEPMKFCTIEDVKELIKQHKKT